MRFLQAGLALGLAGMIAPAPPAVAGASGVLKVPASALSPARLEAISRRYLGTPYRLDPLGEGRGPDPDPLFRRDCVDCQTLVEQVMAEALAPYAGGLDAAVRRIRYRGGRVALADRFHYCIPDWLEAPWPAVDVTREVGGSRVGTVRRLIDRSRLLAERGVTAQLPIEEVEAAYIPRAAVESVEARIPDGSIGVVVRTGSDLVAGHLGFLFRLKGRLVFRHASQLRNAVIDQSLDGFMATGSRRFIGLIVLRPDVRRMKDEGGRMRAEG